MTDDGVQAYPDKSNTEKDSDASTTGDKPMTRTQHSRLSSLCEQAGVFFDEKLTEAEAARRIDELQATSEPGQPQQNQGIENGLISPDPTGNPGSLGKQERQAMPKGAPSST